MIDRDAAVPVAAARAATLMTGFLFCAYALAYYDRLITVVLSQAIKADFGLTDAQLSLINGASFMLIYSVGGLAAGWLIDRYSRKAIVTSIITLWSLATTMCGFAGSFAQLALARAAVGLGECAVTPLAMSVLSDSYRPTKRPMAIAIFYTGGMVGVFASFMLGSHVGEIWGWQWAFFIAGPPGLLLALMILLFGREPAREAVVAAEPVGRSVARAFRQFVDNRPLAWLIVGGSMASYASVGMMQWLPLYFIRSHGMSLGDIGLIFGPVMACGMAGGMLLGGWLGNRMVSVSVPRLIWFSASLVLVTVPLYLVVLVSPSFVPALAVTFFATALAVMWSPGYSSAMQTICDPSLRGMTAAVAGFGAAIVGGALCTLVVGALSDALATAAGAESLRYALIVSMLFLCAGGGCMARSALLQARRG